MDQCASVLLAFPPATWGEAATPSSDDDDEISYHQAVRQHAQNVDKLIKDGGVLLTPGFAQQLLAVVHPGRHSISYLALLQAVLLLDSSSSSSSRDDGLLANITVFLMTFDARQIRYAGASLSSLLDAVANGGIFPASVAVDLITTCLSRLDPTGSMLTSHHLTLATLAYETDNIEPALPVLERTVVFYPGIKGQPEPSYPCSLSLPPSAYITIESGLTGRLTSTMVLQYDFLCGLCFIQRRSWRQALDALERVMSYPTKDNNSAATTTTTCSKIMTEAHNKWVLVSLLATGRTPPAFPPTTGYGPRKTYAMLGKVYYTVAQAFEQGSAEVLKNEVLQIGQRVFDEEQNGGLLKLVMSHFQRWQILNLREIYTKISLEQLRTETESAEKGGPLDTVEEVEALVREMIEDGMLNAVIEKPADKPAHLVYLGAGDETMTEEEFRQEMMETARRMKELEPLVKATNERLASNKDYLKAVIREQKREKMGVQDMSVDFEAQIEDEDLMGGIMASD
ncbi:COP9 signalosome complex subunit 3 [Diplogelasinospora grovesii]|uniref:COP9 signalosome complex subunit 3 n=1 Tax=Diplogelasinospora grovesii TaxID=303347 RepID=A0AAN6NHI1_9PEZI|nr:COP9 signalosome complex subunit 3 [Diplogelasinospora grovesii]